MAFFDHICYYLMSLYNQESKTYCDSFMYMISIYSEKKL